MAPAKGGNAKKESGRAKKTENEANKKAAAAAEKERKEAEAWKDKDLKGGKAAKEAKEEKRKADLARKAENAKMLEQEEASLPSKPKVPKAVQKKKAESVRPAGPGAIAAGGGLAETSSSTADGPHEEIESFSATGIDNALDLLEVVTAKMDKASLGAKAGGLERHPERRFKAAYEAFQERELPNIRQEHPGLRLQQYKELLYKQFQKSPENPFNQANVSYDATKEDKLEALNLKRTEVEERLREKSPT